MPKDLPPEFYGMVDEFIGLANSFMKVHGVERTSAVIMFAAARFNAHCLYSVDPEADQNREDAEGYFVEQYRKMLEDNIDRLKSMNAKESGEHDNR